MLNSLQDGDRVVVFGQSEGVRLQRLLAERRLNVRIQVCPVLDLYRLPQLGSSVGKTVFSHEFVEEFYRVSLKEAAIALDQAAERCSGRAGRSEQVLYEWMGDDDGG